MLIVQPTLGKPQHHRAKPKELHEMVKNDERWQTMTEERKQELIQELALYREAKLLGARVSNRAAALDITKTMARLNEEVCIHPIPTIPL